MAENINLEALYSLVEWLPRDHMEWTTERRREFLQTFALILDYVHPTETTPLPIDRAAPNTGTNVPTEGT